MASGHGQLNSLGPSEFVARCAIFPRYLQDGAIAREALLDVGKLENGKKPPYVYVMSCASRTLLPRFDDVHGFGCRLAERKNNNKAERLGRDLERPRETAHYRGFYDLSVKQIFEICSDGYSLDVVPEPEDGEEAHCNIKLMPDTSKTKKELTQARTDVIVQISNHLRGPVAHLCQEDSDLTSYLSQGPTLPKFSTEPVSQP